MNGDKSLTRIGIEYLKSLANRISGGNANKITITKQDLKDELLKFIHLEQERNANTTNTLVENLNEIEKNYDYIFEEFYKQLENKVKTNTKETGKITNLAKKVNEKEKKQLDAITMYKGEWRKEAPPRKKESLGFDEERG